ncbi:MAG: T9SS type A sorting domain-containing protein [Bacteroidia bacterium]
MKFNYLPLLLVLSFLHLTAIAQTENEGNLFLIKKAGDIQLSEIPSLPDARIISLAPAPLSEIKQKKLELDRLRQNHKNENSKSLNKKGLAVIPKLSNNFNGNVTQGTPNDNDFAISNSGIMMSVVNQNINVYNDTGRLVIGRTLASIASALGSLNRTYDPRVIYDPDQDRFILVFLQGSSSLDTRIVVGFTKTSDPSKAWSFYTIPGNITGDSSWSDYPILSLSKDELFITINRLKDNTFWKNGFLESYIWQIDKMNGFNSDSVLTTKNYNNIQYNGKSIWSICPVKYAHRLEGPGMFFLSHRPSDLSNDTVFVHYISNTIKSGNAVLSTKVYKNPVSYGLQPNALQPNGKKLQTNDARVLSAMMVNGMIYYVGNTIDPNLFSPAVYFGRIEETWTSQSKLFGQIISYDSLDIGYPSISYAGTGQNGDHSSMITFSHVSAKYFPGTSVVYVDRNFNISPPLFVKIGEGSIDLLGDTVDRWGDYTGIQMKFNELGVCWLNGSYGNRNGQNRTWIARIVNQDPLLGVKDQQPIQQFKSYPNPANEEFKVQFEAKEKLLVDLTLMDLQGREIQLMNRDWVKPGLNELRIDTSVIENGMYIVLIKNHGKAIFSHRLLIQH